MADAISIRDAVAAKIAASNDTVHDRIIDILTTKEVERRVDGILKALEERDKLDKELRKIKPDVQTFNEDGSVKDSAYSKGKLDERKKVTERLSKVETAINEALAGNYKKIFEL